MQDITGIILAGGRARRMGGGDKGLLPLAGKPLAAHVAERLRPQTTHLLINANRNAAQYAAIVGDAAAIIPDILPDHPGPLAGMHAGLTAARTEWALFAPCDSPFLPDDLASRLRQAADAARADIACAQANGRTQPVFLLARYTLASSIAAAVQQDERKIDRWITRHPHIAVPFPNAAAFNNINTPQDLHDAETTLAP